MGNEAIGKQALDLGGEQTTPQFPLPITQVGVDLIEVNRITDLIARYGGRFLLRVFTEHELSVCGDRAERLAARYAAKEAVSKALGTGIGRVAWREIEIVNDKAGRPEVVLYGEAADLAAELGLRQWAVSLSHTGEQAIALVVANG